MKKQINFIKSEFENAKNNEIESLINLYKNDTRVGVQRLILNAKNNLIKEAKEIERLNLMLKFENNAYNNGKKRIAGIDEVGRGPLAGPVVTASVIFPKNTFIKGINDSKKLSQKKREQLFQEIKDIALEISINMEDNNTIDEINILEATKISMQKNISKFKEKPDYLIIDALNIETNIETLSIPKADSLSISVAAASIIAKVTRDLYMDEISSTYPEYQFHKNKGYGTKEHIDALLKYGPCPIHRKTFIKNFGF